MTHLLFTDGGARGNPGPAAIGVVIKDPEGIVMKEIGKYIGAATNNDAEYQALILGLKECKDKNIRKLICSLDSLLIVQQLNGEYKVKNSRMRTYWNEVKQLEKSFDEISYIHITRDKNYEADALVNQVLDTL